MNIIPVILSGGSGTRLWPLSRRSRPKQFLTIDGDTSLFRATVARCRIDGFSNKPIVVASQEHRFRVAEELSLTGVSADIILEPVPRNSCAAILLGCLQAIERDPDAIVMILASDHSIRDVQGFQASVHEGYASATAGYLVAFGIEPTFPSTEYGYIRRGRPQEGLGENVLHVDSFIEKPASEKASQLILQGCLWNSGNFLFSARACLDEASKTVPELLECVERSLAEATHDMDFIRVQPEAFSMVEPASFDKMIMENTRKAVIVPASHDWNDLGTWNSIADEMPTDEDGNSVKGDVQLHNSRGNVVYSGNRLTAVSNVEDMVVVTTADAVLVTSRKESGDVNALVGKLQAQARTEATDYPEVYRPWGKYTVVETGERYLVKRLEINPGGRLSLQRHRHRNEHWVVVRGAVEITIGEQVRRLEADQSAYIAKGEIHRLANLEDSPAILIEVQTGDYLDEDDIERLADEYNRGYIPDQLI